MIKIKEDGTIYADPNQPHPWANKTAAEIVDEMTKLLDSFKVKIPDPRPDPFDWFWPLCKAPGYSLPFYANLIVADHQGPPCAPACDCGAAKAKTTHADWCSTKGGPGT
jgi:hypothetical protein